jgi:hypothetical protein
MAKKIDNLVFTTTDDGPKNFEPKCIVVLALDVSGSMS